jgi:hypothetical protein
MIPSELGEKSLKRILLQLRVGEMKDVSTRDLANFHNGGLLQISAHNAHEPYHQMDMRQKHAALVLAYRELRLLVRNPPPGIMAEELIGSEFKVRFIRFENGGHT